MSLSNHYNNTMYIMARSDYIGGDDAQGDFRLFN